jgi:hypothetical protein
VPLLLLGPSFFSYYSFLIHHPVDRDDWHLLAHVMASDFSVTWHFLSKRTIFFVMDQIPHPNPTRSVYMNLT